MKNNIRTINEVAKLTGITVRTLHYYDETDLLAPSGVLDNGYRIYDDECLKKLQQILFFRELGFELKKIKAILNDDGFDAKLALENHRKLLLIKSNRIQSLINLVDKSLKGENNMSFKEFDMSEIEDAQVKYADDVKQRWGNTPAFAQSMNKTKNYTKADWQNIKSESNDIFKEFAYSMEHNLNADTVFEIVRKWKNHITQYYYDCNKEILSGLADMYVADIRFKKNIDKHGEGLAEYISGAIKEYCTE